MAWQTDRLSKSPTFSAYADSNIERPALRQLKQLDLARSLDDLRAPPENRLEKLVGGRAGQWSVRIKDQFRLCFRWTAGGAEDVEIVDYHILNFDVLKRVNLARSPAHFVL